MAKSKILGPTGEPIELELLTREIARPSVASVRQVWNQGVASGLTPEGLAAILSSANEGDAHDYLTLAEEMEERDLHYFGVLGDRKLAITGLPITVEAASDSAEHKKHADFIRTIMDDPSICDALTDMLDALGKSYSALEITWDRTATIWYPQLQHRDPRWFRYDRDTGRELRLLDEQDMLNGIPLPPYKFIVHRPKLKSGLPIRGGLARAVAFAWICKAYALKDWMAFAEVFGMPMRIGYYPPNASEDDVRVLRRAVADMGSDAAAVMPQSMKVEFPEVAGAAGGQDLFLKLTEFLDKQVSKAVLGQTSTSDAQPSGLGSGQAQAHQSVREDIRRADAKAMSDTLNRDLVRAAIDLNFGPQQLYPRVCLKVADKENTAGLVSAVKELVPLGLKVGMSTIRDRLGIPDPDEGEELLTPPAASPFNLGAALNRRAGKKDAPTVQAERLEEATYEAVSVWIGQIKEAVDQAESLEDLQERLRALAPDLNDEGLVKLMGEALAAAAVAGRFDIMEQAGVIR